MRERAGLRVQDVMRALNVTDAAVYSWECGAYSPRAKRLNEIAALYGCTIEDLLAGEDDNSSLPND